MRCSAPLSPTHQILVFPALHAPLITSITLTRASKRVQTNLPAPVFLSGIGAPVDLLTRAPAAAMSSTMMYANAAGGTAGPQITRYNYSQLKDELRAGAVGWAGRRRTPAGGPEQSPMTRDRRGWSRARACIWQTDATSGASGEGVSPAYPSLPAVGRRAAVFTGRHAGRGILIATTPRHICDKFPVCPRRRNRAVIRPTPPLSFRRSTGPAGTGGGGGTPLPAVSLCTSPRAAESRGSHRRCCHLAAR